MHFWDVKGGRQGNYKESPRLNPMIQEFTAHVAAGYQDGMIARKQLSSPCLEVIVTKCRNRTQPTTAGGIVQRQAHGTEPPVAGLRLREQMTFPSRRAGPVIVMREQHHWKTVEKLALQTCGLQPMSVNYIRFPCRHLGQKFLNRQAAQAPLPLTYPSLSNSFTLSRRRILKCKADRMTSLG